MCSEHRSELPRSSAPYWLGYTRTASSDWPRGTLAARTLSSSPADSPPPPSSSGMKRPRCAWPACMRWRDWPTTGPERQSCIDVLCAYLRMPYEADPESPKHREGEREVRHTIIRVIREHLRDPRATTSWCRRNLDFTDAVFDGGDFNDAEFSGGTVSFDRAQFSKGTTSFDGAKFSGGTVSFRDAKFSGSTVSFALAKFFGGRVLFYADFSGSSVSFLLAEFSGGEVSFNAAEFSGGKVFFRDARFSGAEVTFDGAEFVSGTVDFRNVRDWSSPPHFDFAEPPPGVLLPAREADVAAPAQATDPSATTDESDT
jgi:hypothetical protein